MTTTIMAFHSTIYTVHVLNNSQRLQRGTDLRLYSDCIIASANIASFDQNIAGAVWINPTNKADVEPRVSAWNDGMWMER